jgi:hypothetical protein
MFSRAIYEVKLKVDDFSPIFFNVECRPEGNDIYFRIIDNLTHHSLDVIDNADERILILDDNDESDNEDEYRDAPLMTYMIRLDDNIYTANGNIISSMRVGDTIISYTLLEMIDDGSSSSINSRDGSSSSINSRDGSSSSISSHDDILHENNLLVNNTLPHLNAIPRINNLQREQQSNSLPRLNAIPRINNLRREQQSNSLPENREHTTFSNVIAEPLEISIKSINLSEIGFDMINQEEIDIRTYLNDDINNIVFKFNNMYILSNKQTLLEYSLSNNSNTVYKCYREDTALYPRFENLDLRSPYFKVNALPAMIGGLIKMSQLKTIINSPNIRIIQISSNPIDTCASVASLEMLYSRNALSANHCQAGNSMPVYDCSEIVSRTRQEIRRRSRKNRKHRKSKRRGRHGKSRKHGKSRRHRQTKRR